MIDIGQQAGENGGGDNMPPVALRQHRGQLGIFGKYRAGNRKKQVAFRRHDKTL